jgi:hypothetical protein
VTCMPINRQQLGKHISSVRQRSCKLAYLKKEALLSAWSVQSGYKEVFDSIEQ